MLVRANPHNEAARLALLIYESTLSAVEGSHLVRQALSLQADLLFIHGEPLDLSAYSRILVAGAGKASLAMARGVSQILGNRVDAGLIVTKETYDEPISGIEVVEGGHPVPDERSLSAGTKMLDFAANAGEGDLVIFLLSGGASALMEALPDETTLQSVRQLNQEMLASGLDIRQMNGIRKRLSRTKNGRLARAFAPAKVIVLVISDVIGSNPLPVVGSGPFMPPEKYLQDVGWLPPTKLADLQELREFTEPFPQVPHYVIGSVSLAIQEAATAASALGLSALPFSNPLTGDARQMARNIVRQANVELDRRDDPFCMIFGGECTVRLKGKGLGGRCQDMAMSVIPKMRYLQSCALIVAGTDGSDGPTSAAGGLVDPDMCLSTSTNWRDSMKSNDSYNFLVSVDGLVATGPTGSNVNDLALFVSAPE